MLFLLFNPICNKRICKWFFYTFKNMKHTQAILIISVIINLLLALVILIAVIRYHNEIYKKITAHKSYNIVMFGNSLTAHCNWSRELKRSDVRNSGFPGYTTFNYLQILEKHVINHKPKLCFIEGGINDIGLGISQEYIQKNYRIIIEKLLKNNIEPVLQSTLYVNYEWEITNQATKIKVDSLNDFLQNLAIEKKLTYIDLNRLLSENGKLKSQFQVDGLHLNNNAYKIWAEEVEKILKKKKF